MPSSSSSSKQSTMKRKIVPQDLPNEKKKKTSKQTQPAGQKKKDENQIRWQDLVPDCDESVKKTCVKVAKLDEDEILKPQKLKQNESTTNEKKTYENLLKPEIDKVVKQIEELRKGHAKEAQDLVKNGSCDLMVECGGYDVMGGATIYFGSQEIQVSCKNGIHSFVFKFDKESKTIEKVKEPIHFETYANREKGEEKLRNFVENDLNDDEIFVLVVPDSAAKSSLPLCDCFRVLENVGGGKSCQVVEVSKEDYSSNSKQFQVEKGGLITNVESDSLVKKGLLKGLTIGAISYGNNKPKSKTHISITTKHKPEEIDKIISDSIKKSGKKINLHLSDNRVENNQFPNIPYRKPFIFIGSKKLKTGEAKSLIGAREELVRLSVKMDEKEMLKFETGKIDYTELVKQPSGEELKQIFLEKKLEKQKLKDDELKDDENDTKVEKEKLSEKNKKIIQNLFENYQIAIPSHNRVPMLKEKTLSLLEKLKVEKKKIHIFVSEDQLDDYKEKFEKENYKVVKGRPGTRANREAIADYFHENFGGCHVVSLDDDIEKILVKNKKGMDHNSLREIGEGEFDKLIRFASELMVVEDSKIWGCSTSANPRSMWNWGISRKLGVVNGYLYGFIAQSSKEKKAIFPVYGSATEDVERSLRYFSQYGKLLRLRFLTCETKCYTNKGGLQTTCQNRKQKECRQIYSLNKEFPELIILDEKKSGQTVSVKFAVKGCHPLFTAGVPWLDTNEKEENEKKEKVVDEDNDENLEKFVRSVGGALLSSRR